jgi:DNA-binding transcriptional regulator YiaG
MADPQQEFVHPVIEAMLGAYDRIQQAKNVDFNQKLNTREADLRQAQFDELQKQHKLESDRAERQLEINLETLRQNLRQNQLNEAGKIQELLNSGVNPERGDLNVQSQPQTLTGPNGEQTQLPAMPNISFPGQGNYKIPNTNIELNPESYTSPQEQIQRQLDALKQKTTVETQAQQSALEPFKTRDEARATANRLTEIGLQGRNAAEVARVNHANQIELENLRGHFQLAAAQIAHNHGNEN